MNCIHPALLAGALLAVCSPAPADSLTTNLVVSAKTVGRCAISASDLAFSTTIPTPIQTNWDASSTLTVTCSAPSSYSIALSLGAGGGASCAARKMLSAGGGDTLDYNLFIDPARTQVWGNGAAGCANLYIGTGTGAPQLLSVYGRIPPQTPALGAFGDTVVATMTF